VGVGVAVGGTYVFVMVQVLLSPAVRVTEFVAARKLVSAKSTLWSFWHDQFEAT
jgi:hypothetical protein